jgi:hypothetical protein
LKIPELNPSFWFDKEVDAKCFIHVIPIMQPTTIL